MAAVRTLLVILAHVASAECFALTPRVTRFTVSPRTMSACARRSFGWHEAHSGRDYARPTILMSVPSEAPEVDCLVVGGGISGLAAAFFADKAGASVLLGEKSTQLGGVIQTQTDGTVQWEEGPNTFQASAKAMLRLVADLGLSDQIVASDPKLPRFVYSDNKLYALPKDIPKLLSPWALLRAAVGILLPQPAPASADETVASFIERTLGKEVLDKVVDPFVSTVYTGDPAKMSFASVFPAIARVAANSNTVGGLLVGAIKSRLNGPPPRDYGVLPPVPKGASLSLRGGLTQLPATARVRLSDKCQTGWEATSLQQRADGAFDVCFSTDSGTKTVRAKAVVVATPAPVAAKLLSSVSPNAGKMLADIRAPPVFAVTVSYPSSAFAPGKCVDEDTGALAAFGVLIPSSAVGLKTLGFQFISSLFKERAPAGQEVLLAYYGGAQKSDTASMTTDEVVAAVHADAQKMLLKPDSPPPSVLSVHKWDAGIPQYDVGHAHIISAVKKELPPGVVLCGNAFGGGISLGDCAKQALASADEVLAVVQ